MDFKLIPFSSTAILKDEAIDQLQGPRQDFARQQTHASFTRSFIQKRKHVQASDTSNLGANSDKAPHYGKVLQSVFFSAQQVNSGTSETFDVAGRRGRHVGGIPTRIRYRDMINRGNI